MTIPTSGDPRVILYGVLDQSIPPLVFAPAKKPISTPLSFTFASEGLEDFATRSVGDNARQMYGHDIFDLDTSFATSNTKFIKMFNETNACSQIFHRLVPDDATPASLRLYAEYVKTEVPMYKRTPTGDYLYGPDNRPIQDGTMEGISIVWRIGNISTESGGFKQAKTFQGTMVATGKNAGTKSTIVPILDLPASSRCRKNNDRGIRLSCPNAKSSAGVDKNIIQDIGARLINIQLIDSLVPGTSPSVIKTLDGASTFTASLKPKAYYSQAKMPLDFERQFLKSYRNMNPKSGMPHIISPFSDMHIYRDNLELLLTQIKEVMTAAEPDDINTDDIYMYDAFTGMDINGNPYNAVIVDTGREGGIVLSERHNHFMTSGSDGTTTQAVFDELVRKEMMRFGDGPVPYLDTLKYPFKFLWDTGFTIDTKQALCNAIGRRMDTIVGLATHVHGEPANTIQKENSMKIALSAMLAANPESPKYGTSAFRGFLMGHSYILNDEINGNERTPCIYTLAKYTTQYAGSELGFRREFRFDRGELAIVNDGYDINLTYKPQAVYASDWEKGLINIRTFDEEQYTIPALYTVYPHDRSILNGYLPAIVAADLEFIATQVWSEMSGSQTLTDSEVINMMAQKITLKTLGRYDSVCDILPKPYMSAEDKSNGNTISCDIEMSGGVLKGIHKYTIIAKRRASEV